MYLELQKRLAGRLRVLLNEKYGLQLESIPLETPPDLQFGELATPIAFELARSLRKAPKIIAQEIGRFAQWLGELDVRPTIAMLHARGDQIAEQLLEENAGRWESASSRDLARVEALARAVVARLLHEPTIRLRSLDAERVHGSIELLRDLFALRGAVDDAGRNPAPAREDAHDNVRELRSGNP